MSYDLAVWEGGSPAGEKVALATFLALYEKWFGDDEPPPDEDPTPTQPIQRYVAALLERWPDITTDAGDESPWADGPLEANAAGNFFFFSLVWSRAEEAAAYCADLATRHGLVCFDPQTNAVRSSP